MSSQTIKLRSDVLITGQNAGDQEICILKDPVTERFFRFKEVEGFILRQLDGVATNDEIIRGVQQRFNFDLSKENLEQFLERIRKIGLLDDNSSRPTSEKRFRNRIRGDIFYLRVKIFNPDRLLDRLNRMFGFAYTKAFLVFSICCFVAAVGINISHWPEITHSLGTMFRFHSLFAAWVVVLSVILIHELSHGLTCKRYGGNVPEIGFLLIYFMPAFYCNVSDAWLIREKSKRLLVSFAGAFSEITVWSLATIAWRVTEPNTFINFASLIIVVTSGFKQLFNMNPLIKLDGYYLLSDYLEIPNLRAKASTYLRNLYRSLWHPAASYLHTLTQREKKILFLYGTLAGVYTTWLLGYFILNFGGYLIARYQGWGFAAISIIVIRMNRNPLRKMFAPLSLPPWAHTTYARFKSQRKSVKIILVLSVLLLLGYFISMQLTVSGDFVILPVQNADVRTEVEGIIATIYHDEGDVVEKGMPIADLSGRDVRAELGKVKAQIEEKSAKLKLLEAGARPEELTLAKTVVEKADERLKYAKKDLEMDRTLMEKEIISAKQFAQSEGLVALREKELQEVRDQLKILLAGSRKEEIDATKAELGSLQAQERFLDEQMKSLTIVSPISGIVTTHKLREKIGQNVNKGDLIAKVYELKNVEAEIAIPEKEIADIRMGARVLLKAQAFPQENFEGVITSIAPTAAKQADRGDERSITVVTRLENSSMLLKPEMSGNAKIYCGEQRLISIVARRFVRFFRVEFWSWW
jgi:multidrug resistance efflux pump